MNRRKNYAAKGNTVKGGGSTVITRADNASWAKRIAATLNACKYITTEELEDMQFRDGSRPRGEPPHEPNCRCVRLTPPPPEDAKMIHPGMFLRSNPITRAELITEVVKQLLLRDDDGCPLA